MEAHGVHRHRLGQGKVVTVCCSAAMGAATNGMEVYLHIPVVLALSLVVRG